MVIYKKIYLKKNDETILAEILQFVEVVKFPISEVETEDREIISNIPMDENNRDYQKYLLWRNNGGIESEETIFED